MEKKTINILEKKKVLKKQLENTDWEEILYPFIDSIGFDHILIKLLDEVNKKRRFTPPILDWFRPFIECKKSDLKVIMINQDPSPKLGEADGMAFSSSKTNIPGYLLHYIHDYIEKQNGYVSRQSDLSCWANQGILLLNSSITVELNKIGSHYMIWHSFTTHLLKELNKDNSNYIVILFGKKAMEWELLLPNHTILKVKHPASAAYKNNKWDADGMFEKINLHLKNQSKDLIKW